MRLRTTILFQLLVCNIYAQKWHLNKIDKSLKFKYEYLFQFDDIDDTSSYTFVKNPGDSISTIQLTDNEAEALLSASIKIKGIDNDTLINIVSDIDGIGVVKLKPGKYRIEISTISYDKFSLDFAVSEGEHFDLNVKLGSGLELEIYQINSKTKIKEQEIISIMNCVKENRKKSFKKCDENKSYFISLQI